MSAIALNAQRSSDGQYIADGFFGMTGDFDAVIRVPGATWRVTLPSR
ncbi:MAG: hypothetical protein HC933_03235 [Pleurocapsa sp. SU_196_0]|nr:hypothetical protein [Pleurocapsa sp. SU_196_0]